METRMSPEQKEARDAFVREYKADVASGKKSWLGRFQSDNLISKKTLSQRFFSWVSSFFSSASVKSEDNLEEELTPEDIILHAMENPMDWNGGHRTARILREKFGIYVDVSVEPSAEENSHTRLFENALQKIQQEDSKILEKFKSSHATIIKETKVCCCIPFAPTGYKSKNFYLREKNLIQTVEDTRTSWLTRLFSPITPYVYSHTRSHRLFKERTGVDTRSASSALEARKEIVQAGFSDTPVSLPAKQI